LARAGYEVVVAARTPSEIRGVADEVTQLGATGWSFQVDVTDAISVAAMVARLTELGPGLEVLVNSAGAAVLGTMAETPPAIFERMLSVNLSGVYQTIYQCRELLMRGRGHVINVASRAGRRPYDNAVAYGTAKAGLVYLTRALAMDLGKVGIRVNAISPGAVATALRREAVPGEDPATLLAPEEVADCVMDLLRPGMSKMTGTVVDFPW